LNIKSFQIKIPFQEAPLPKITMFKKVQTSMEFFINVFFLKIRIFFQSCTQKVKYRAFTFTQFEIQACVFPLLFNVYNMLTPNFFLKNPRLMFFDEHNIM